MPFEGECFLTGGRVPDFQRLVKTSADDAFAVGAERHAPDVTGMPFESECLLTGGRVPDFQRLVTTSADDAFAVGAERHAGDATGMPFEGRASEPIGRADIGLPSRNRSKSFANSMAEPNRLYGSFSKHFEQIVSGSLGIVPFSFRGLGASSFRTWCSNMRELPRKGRSPVSSSKRMTPSE